MPEKQQDCPMDGRRMDRRRLLQSLGIAAGGVALTGTSAFPQPASAAEQQSTAEGAALPGGEVEDRTSGIRITGVRPFPLGVRLFVRIDTNYGVSGWGETSGLKAQPAAVLARSFADMLVGENPTRIEFLWQRIFRAHRNLRGGPFMVYTLSAIDMALWDIAGKLWGAPVHSLLGGPCRDRIRGYSSDVSWKAPPGGPYEHAADPSDIQQMLSHIRRARERVGPEGTVMFDAHCAIPPAALIQFAAAIEPYDVLFIEEPVVMDNLQAMKRIRESISIPLATGEHGRTIWQFIPLLQERAIDILQPDVGHCGGISQMVKIATLAEAYYVPLAPHCTMSLLGISASLHVSSYVPLFLIHETYPHLSPDGLVQARWEFDRTTGYATIPEGPGLGVEVDEEVLARMDADPPPFQWPNRRLSGDGAITEY